MTILTYFTPGFKNHGEFFNYLPDGFFKDDIIWYHVVFKNKNKNYFEIVFFKKIVKKVLILPVSLPGPPFNKISLYCPPVFLF